MSAQFPEGNGIFETIKTIDGVPFALSRHTARATRSAAILGIPIPPSDEIAFAVEALLDKTPKGLKFGRLRMSFDRAGEMDLLHETYHPWVNPAKLMILDSPIDENSPTVGMKTLPFTQHLECLALARKSGFDDGVRFNLKGEVSESAVSNLLLKVGNRWVTPNLASGCLPGITRELILEWFDVEEVVVTKQVLNQATSIYLLSSLKDAQPVSILEGKTLEIDTQLRQELLDRMTQNINP